MRYLLLALLLTGCTSFQDRLDRMPKNATVHEFRAVFQGAHEQAMSRNLETWFVEYDKHSRYRFQFQDGRLYQYGMSGYWATDPDITVEVRKR